MDEITKEEIGSVFGEPKNYPRYQASFFIGNGGRDNQIVVRHDSWKAFVGDLVKVRKIQDESGARKVEAEVEKKAAEAFTSTPKEDHNPLRLTCPYHGDTLVWRPAGVSKRTGKPYDGFLSCSAKKEDGSYCNWTPPKDAINKEKTK